MKNTRISLNLPKLPTFVRMQRFTSELVMLVFMNITVISEKNLSNKGSRLFSNIILPWFNEYFLILHEYQLIVKFVKTTLYCGEQCIFCQDILMRDDQTRGTRTSGTAIYSTQLNSSAAIVICWVHSLNWSRPIWFSETICPLNFAFFQGWFYQFLRKFEQIIWLETILFR